MGILKGIAERFGNIFNYESDSFARRKDEYGFPAGIESGKWYRPAELSQLCQIPISTIYLWMQKKVLNISASRPVRIKADVLLFRALGMRGGTTLPRINRWTGGKTVRKGFAIKM